MGMIEISRGDDRDLNFTLTTDGTTPFNLTGCTVTFMVGTMVGQTADKLSKAMTVTDAVNGLATVSLTNAETDDLNGTFAYRVKVVTAAGKVRTADSGTFKVVDQVL